MTKRREITRREFVKDVATVGAGLTIVPRHVLGRGMTPPSDLLNIAGVGVGGMGRANVVNLSSQNIVALCDVDWGYADKGFSRLDADIQNLSKRIEAPDPEPQPGKTAFHFDREQAKFRLAAMQRLKDVHLPKAKRYSDYREMLEKTKRYRRRPGSHSRSHARNHCACCHGIGKTCLRTEAHGLVRFGSAATGQTRARN